MKLLNNAFLADLGKNIKKAPEKILPEKILMFGEGNFLRAFIGSIVQKMNDSGSYCGSIVALQGTGQGMSEVINSQDGLYTVIERGFAGGKVIENIFMVNALSRCINPYNDYESYIELAKNENIEIIISNTTEFGICYDKNEPLKAPHKNFPAKLTDWLYERYRHFSGDKKRGVHILPCELIDKNGDALYENTVRYAKKWRLEPGFIKWLENSCNFCNTLVDRIVSGYPGHEAQSICEKLKYKDSLIDICEPFLLWVIETKKPLPQGFPLKSSGYKIIVTDDMSFYRTRKVRILNGAHTISVLSGHLCGLTTVEELVSDGVFLKYINSALKNEIIPNIKGDMNGYAEDVIARFKNPFLKHKLLSIALNSVSKFKARVLVSIKDYINNFSKSPYLLGFSFAALIAFYKAELNSAANDEQIYIDKLKEHFSKEQSAENMINGILSDAILWDEDLCALFGLKETVLSHYNEICKDGIYNALKKAVRFYE